MSISPSFRVNAPIICLNTFSNEGQKVYAAAHATGCPPFTLVSIRNLDGSHDTVPWDSPPIIKIPEPCTGGADDYLRLLIEAIIPTAEKELPELLAGAGLPDTLCPDYLLCTPSTYQPDLFSRVGNMSSSLWLPGMKEYIFSHEPKRRPDCVYFPWVTKRAKRKTRFCEVFDRTQRRFMPSIKGMASTQCSS